MAVSRRGVTDPVLATAATRWRETTLSEHVEAAPEVAPAFRTGSGELEVQALYTPADSGLGGEAAYLEKVGFPGEYPFTRGRRPGGHRTFPWKLGFYAGYGSPRDANRRLRQLVEAGAGYINVALDLPSQCGYDPDHPLARDDVGKVGVSVMGVADFADVYDGVPLDRIGTGTVGNCIGPQMVGLFTLAAESQGLRPEQAHVLLQNDPLKEYTGRGTYIVPIEPAVELAADVVEFCIRERPGWIPQYACSTQLRWGGVNASEEIGFGIANLFAYVDRVVARGLTPAEVVPRLEGLHMTTDNDLFEEVAKFRAARRLWARLAAERYGTRDPDVVGLKITTFTGAHRLTAQQPLNNLTRTSMHVLASLLGGVERLTIPGFDEALALPTEESTRIANLSKMIILYEHGIANTVDPLGGSHFVETLTDELERRAEDVVADVERRGGAVAAIEQGVYDAAMQSGMKAQQLEIEAGTRMVAGVNRHCLDEEPHIELFAADEGYQQRQLARLEELRRTRDGAAAAGALATLREALERKQDGARLNAVPAVVDALRAGATMGEMGALMRDVLGTYRPGF